jgi:hypothetical protein
MMVSPRSRRQVLGAVLGLLLAVGIPAAEPARYAPGAKLDTLTVGATTYRQVTVQSVSARTVMILHRGGMASVKLRDLAPDLQARFGYDPAAERESDTAWQKAAAERQAQQAAAAQSARVAAAAGPAAAKFDRLLQDFGRPAELQKEVDLRPRFRALELHAKDQGRRPSCAVFAVVSALEFIHAENTGQADKFSEEYLVWATGRSIQRPGVPLTGEDADAGFALTEVVTALRTYGIPLQKQMPNTIGRTSNIAAEPTPEVIAAARSRAQVAVHHVPGRDTATQLNNIVHALNVGLPVAIGTAWPRFTNMRAAMLNSQEPSYSHAVTVVGYRSPTGRLEDATFIFKNSWGAAWGANGYGFATYAYLAKHLNSAVLLELRPPT